MRTMIHFKGVTLEREEQTLLNNVDLHIGEGEFVYLIGKVGAGKSSLLKSLYAELPISSGRAEIFEYDLAHLRRNQIPYLRRRLGIIFQDFQLLIDRTVNENLEFVLKATGWNDKRLIAERIEEVLSMVGLENKGYRMPNTLSGGEQQRVVIARALLNKPSIILADEPTGNLDPETGCNIVQLLYEICHTQHTAVLMSTHNLQLLEQFPGRVLRVENQKLVEEMEEEIAETISDANTEMAEESMLDETPEHENVDIVEEEPATAAEEAPATECMEESAAETETAVCVDPDSSNNDEDHCSPSESEPEEPRCNGQSDQIPSESAVL